MDAAQNIRSPLAQAAPAGLILAALFTLCSIHVETSAQEPLPVIPVVETFNFKTFEIDRTPAPITQLPDIAAPVEPKDAAKKEPEKEKGESSERKKGWDPAIVGAGEEIGRAHV